MEIKREKKLKKILLIRLSSFGDILLSTHIPKLIKMNYPEINISVLTTDIFCDIFKYNKSVDDIIPFNKNGNDVYSKINNLIKKNNYDYIIDLQNNRKSNKIIEGIEKNKIAKYQKSNWKKFLLVHFGINPYKTITKVPDKYINTTKQLLPLPKNNACLEFNFLKSTPTILPPATKIRIAIAPGAKHFTKCYPPEKYIELINLIHNCYDAEIVLMGAKEDETTSKYIESKSKIEYDLTGQTSLLETAEVINSVDLVISNDSALMHVASSQNTPVIAIFGSTVEEFGFFPYNSKYIVVEDKTVKCRPCTHIGRSKCPKKHFSCMNNIKPENILKSIKEFI
jgi:heptosyltransferase-2